MKKMFSLFLRYLMFLVALNPSIGNANAFTSNISRSDLASSLVTEYTNFEQCKIAAYNIYAKARKYPAREILVTDDSLSIKLWKGSDKALLVSCSKTDNKILVVDFNY